MKKTKQLAKMRAWEEECNKKYTVLQPVCLGVCYSSLMPKDTRPADPIVDKLNCYMVCYMMLGFFIVPCLWSSVIDFYIVYCLYVATSPPCWVIITCRIHIIY